MHSFKTHDVDINTQERKTVSGRRLWEERLLERTYNRTTYQVDVKETARLWNCSDGNFLNFSNNALVSAVGLAYNVHLPLSLSPDAIWSTIAHGFSVWINQNAEKVRKKFVSHDGKKKLVVEIPLHEAANPNWDRILGEFSDMLADHIGNKRDMFINDFSTTNTNDRIGSEALLMYGMSKYFDYGMKTLCGFPKITIEGDPEDWEKIAGRVKFMSEFKLGKDDQLAVWLDKLTPVVEQFVTAAKGNPDIDFWRSFYREDGGSGGPYINGHVINLFPYLTNYKQVLFANDFEQIRGMGGPTLSNFPNTYSPVDVEWEDLAVVRDMKFYGGVVGVSFVDNTVRPEVGWAISENLEKK